MKHANLYPFDLCTPLDILWWKIGETLLGRRNPRRNEPFITPRADNDGSILLSSQPSLTWIGHSSFILRLGGMVIAMDPIWSERAGHIRRRSAPGIDIESLPPIDVITISHAHYDHMDLATLDRLTKHTERLTGCAPAFIVPTGVSRYLNVRGPVFELGWWEDRSLYTKAGEARFRLVPQQHWSARTPFDRDEALWGGWVISSAEGTAYHSGDTGYFDLFEEIGKRAGPIDWAMLPIGAYDPSWLLSAQHLNPEQAGRAFLALGARNLIPMHWGTFKLSDEPFGEPPLRLAEWWDHEIGADFERLWLMRLGETRSLSASRMPSS